MKAIFICTWIGMDRNLQTDEPVRGRCMYKFEGSGHGMIVTDPRSHILIFGDDNEYELNKRYSFDLNNATPD